MRIASATTAAQPSHQSCIRVCLLNRFEVLSDDDRLDIPYVGSRVIAYLALQALPVTRSRVAGVLWPETTEERAQASLRSALWRVNRVSQELIQSHNHSLSLGDEVGVDVDGLLGSAVELMSDDVLPDLSSGGELLPDWPDDWVLFERERLRLSLLDRMEEASAYHRRAGNARLATEYAMMAIRLEPLRESARRVFIHAQLAQGNIAEAISHFRRYVKLLDDELSVPPSRLLVDLIESTGYRVSGSS